MLLIKMAAAAQPYLHLGEPRLAVAAWCLPSRLVAAVHKANILAIISALSQYENVTWLVATLVK